MKKCKRAGKFIHHIFICNDMMYNTWKEIAERVPDFFIMTTWLPTMEIRLVLADYEKQKQNFKYRN